MDAEALHTQQDEDTPHANWLSRCLAKKIFDSMLQYLMRTDQWFMGSFTYPSGTKLLTWNDLLHYTGMSDTNSPPWYRKLEQETLVSPATDNRTLKQQYFDSPFASINQGFCYSKNDALIILNPMDIPPQAQGTHIYHKYTPDVTPTGNMHTFTYNGTTNSELGTPTYIPDIGCPVPLC